MLRQFDSAAWNSPWRGEKSCRRFSGSVEGQPLSAVGEWSWHCDSTSAEISTESYYYALTGAPVLLRTDIGLSRAVREASAAVRALIEAKLTARFGQPVPEAPLYPISPAGGVRALQWHAKQADLLLFDGPFYLSPLGPQNGVRLIAVARPLADAIEDDARLRDLFDFGLDSSVQERLARELGPIYAPTAATAEKVVRLLTSRKRDAAALLGADEMVFQVSAALDEAKAVPVRRELEKYGIRLGPMRKDGIEYDHDLLQEAWRRYPNTEWGQYAFLLLQQFGWDPSFDGYSCPANPDSFREVIAHGEAFLAGHPQSSVRLQVLLAVATGYETWWSVSLAPSSDENYGAYPRRPENTRLKDTARLQAIARYEQIQREDPGSVAALFAARHLPRLRLSFDTGFRHWFCVGD